MLSVLRVLCVAAVICVIGGMPLTANSAPLDKACIEKLADEKLYDKYKMDSYAMLVPGKNGWLYRSGTDFDSNFKYSAKAVEWLKETQNAFEKEGITLVIAYPPSRGFVAGGNIPAETRKKYEFDPDQAATNYKKSLSDLQKKGIHIVGVPNFKKNEGFFRKRDQHWNAKGARQTAKNVGDFVKTLPVYEKLDHQEFITTQKEPYTFDGRFGDVTRKFCRVELDQEEDQEFETTLKDKPEQNEEDALFSDIKPAQVVLIGTSNSKANAFNVNFDGFLKEYLSADVDNYAIAGAGIEDPFYAYLSSESFKNHPPKLIVWEIPSYYSLTDRDVPLFQQLIAGVQGSCEENALAESGPIEINGKKISLFEDLEDKGIMGASNRLYLEFDEPFKKKFTYEILYADDKGTRKGFRFERTKRFPYNGIYSSVLHNYTAPIEQISINAPGQMQGRIVEAYICAAPG